MDKKLTLCGLLVGVFFLADVAPRPSHAQSAGNTTFINSTVTQDVYTNLTPIVTTARGYNTQVLGILSNNGSNTTVFNVTVDAGVNLNEVRQQVALARQAVQTTHSGTGNANLQIQPTQLTTSQAAATVSNSIVTNTPNGEVNNVTTEAVLGPNVTTYGPERSLTFNIAAGTTNFNTVVYTDRLFNSQTTTTNTTRKSAVYQVVSATAWPVRVRAKANVTSPARPA